MEMQRVITLTLFVISFLSHKTFTLDLHLTSDPNADKTVIVLGFSGLRWDSIAKGHMPVLNTLSRHGALVLQKRSAFQTETLPSFETMFTGVYPENHGMMSNRIRDTIDGSIFKAGNRGLRWWGTVEPVWVTHERNNPNRTALCLWPGHDVKFKNVTLKYTCPLVANSTHYVNPFNELARHGISTGATLPLKERLNIIVEWLKQKERPRFIASYFENPFNVASKHGVESKEYLRALSEVDYMLELLVKDLKRIKLFHRVNIIITGESGITDTLTGKEIYLEDYLPENLKESYDVVDNNGIMTIMPHNLADVNVLFSKFNHSNENMEVYKKESLPDQFHFKHKTRTMPLILVAKEGWRIYSKRVKNPNDKRKAFMGYAASNPSTHALFIALGPAFKRNVRLDTMQNVDVYQLICHALRLEPRPHNGSGYVHTQIAAKIEQWYWHMAKTVVRSTTGLTAVIIISLCLFFLSMYALINVIYSARSRCRCPRRRMMPQLRKKQPYRDSGREGVKHLLSDEEELSGSDIELGSDLDSDFDIKHIQS